MGITKIEDVVAWQDGNRIICRVCCDPAEALPLTKTNFEESDIVTCDECLERIL